MKRRIIWLMFVLAVGALIAADAFCRGGRGGGGGPIGGSIGGGRGPSGGSIGGSIGGGSLPSAGRPSMPSVNRPSMPSRGPTMSRPSLPSTGAIGTRPSSPRPTLPMGGGADRSRSSILRLPTSPLPGDRGLPSATLPGLPATRPSLPSTLPGLPAMGPSLPSGRPNIPTLNPGLELPGIGDAPARPSRGILLPDARPSLPNTSAGISGGISGGISSLPARPGVDGISSREMDLSKDFSSFNVDRNPAPRSREANVAGRANTRDIVDSRNNRQPFRSEFPDNARQRAQQRRDRGQELRDNWRDGSREFLNEFKDDVGKPGWRLEYPELARAFHDRKDDNHQDWWKKATAAALVRAVRNGYFEEDDEPLYFDYGMGGDVYYEGDTVYVNQQPVAADMYATEAQQIASAGETQLLTLPAGGTGAPATVGDNPAKPANRGDAAESSWTPLGVFALSTSSEESRPTRFMQLAVDKNGVIAGTLFNIETKKTLPIIGSVDRKSQRACWSAGDKKEVVAETSYFNLAKDEVPVLIHFGKDRTEEYLLVRLDSPTAVDAAENAAKPMPADSPGK